MHEPRVGGLTLFSTTDYPGCLAAVVFCQGCPWRCAYCHNPHLLPARGKAVHPWSEVLAFLHRRRGLLDAVVFSGGEPTLQSALPAAMAQVRGLGFKVGLHTAGMYPERLAAALSHADWVGLDVKAGIGDYPAITGVAASGEPVRESLRLLRDAGVDYECRTTWSPDLYEAHALSALADELRAAGVRRWAVQICRSTRTFTAPRTLAPGALEACLAMGEGFEGFALRG
jgi:pyruvate formate lyase activating enzyme